MNLTDLETFARAVQEGSLSAAARGLSLSQPAVSSRLRRLEREVGEPLLRRTGRGVRPTAKGALLYRRCLSFLEQARQLDQEIRSSGELRGRLSLGATDLVAIYHLPSALRRLRRRYPLLEVSVHVEGSATLLRLLEEGQVELGLATLPVPEPRFETIPLYRDPVVIVGSPKHPLAGRKSVRPQELAAQVWITHKRESVTRQLLEGFFTAHGVSLRIEMENSSPEAIKKLVQARLGLAALPACSVRRELAEGSLARIPVKDFHLDRSSGLVLRRRAPLSRAASALQELLVAAARSPRSHGS